MILVTDDKWKAYKKAKKCFTCYYTFTKNTGGRGSTIKKFETIFIMQENIEMLHIYNACNMHYRILGSIPVIIYNCFKYDNHVIITQLPEEFETEDFECISDKIQRTLVLVGENPLKISYSNKNTEKFIRK